MLHPRFLAARQTRSRTVCAWHAGVRVIAALRHPMSDVEGLVRSIRREMKAEDVLDYALHGYTAPESRDSATALSSELCCRHFLAALCILQIRMSRLS